MLPDLESLRCFEAVARRRSFRVAAQELALSPAAVSGRIQRLEADLGTTLLTRSTRRVELTLEGAAVLAEAERCLAAAAACVRAARSGVPQVDIRLGTRHELGMGWLVPHLDDLSALEPSRHIHLLFGDGRSLVDAVRRGTADAAVLSIRLSGEPFEMRPLHDESYVAVVAPSLGCVPSSPDDIQGLTLLDTVPDLPLFRYLADAVGSGEPWQFSKVEHLGTIAAIRRRARMGAGFAVLPEAFVARDLAEGTLLRAFADVTLPTDVFRLLWMRGDPRTPVFDQLARHLRSLPLVYDES